MKIKLEKLNKKQAELENFFEGVKSKSVTGPNLRKWIIDSVTHFTEVGVSPNIVDYFLKSCDFQKDDEGKESHGVFIYKLTKGGYILRDQGRGTDGSPFIIPILTALGVSRMLIDKYEEEERVIPKSLIQIFNNDKGQSIKIALESIESNYQTEDSVGMVVPLVTVTDLVCGLIPELPKDKNINFCLKKIYDEKVLQERYNINREIIWSLNNARIIRNEEIAHIKLEHDGSISMHEAVGYAHLLVLFIDSLFASGNLDLD